MKVPRLFSETWTQTSKLAGEEGLSLCEARVCAGIKQNNLLLVSVMAAAARETLIFYILVFARASSNRMNALSSKRENDVIFSVFLPPKKS